MKKRTATILLLILWSSISYAQKGWEVGIKALPQAVVLFNADDWEAGDFVDYVFTTSLAYGGTLGWNLTNHVGLQTGIFFSPQGQKFKHPGLVLETSRQKLNYLKVPLMLKINTSPDKASSFILTAGAQVGFLTKVEVFEDGELIDFEQRYGIVAKEIYNSQDIGLVGSLGFRFKFTRNSSFEILLRGDYSLMDVEDKTARVNNNIFYWNQQRPDSQNITLGLQTGLNFYIR